MTIHNLETLTVRLSQIAEALTQLLKYQPSQWRENIIGKLIDELERLRDQAEYFLLI
ncbi:hypothetical protein ACSJL2_003817 [Serratia sarumanii]|uniref:hypothetical protein n=1 Tax=Serratia TaxID=613 RepID=UPI0007452C54|nr:MULTISPECIES: hypothetical protein [Serratia]CAE7781447.1 hypothetical protein AI2795V1_3639 [Serratia marcescens]CAH3837834.1 hypothetical protein AI2795V1_3639 [Serratia marcescens]CUZ52550.1 Uncharacterised protein [Serratia marcescens]CUZ76286.1 Uncharacterised protein [Serratia marcescens]CVA16520.1 Uncharacterised protein [Serratia marcescens]